MLPEQVYERYFSIVQVVTDEGITSIGCALIGNPLSVTAIIERNLKRLLVGETLFAVERIREKMH